MQDSLLETAQYALHKLVILLEPSTLKAVVTGILGVLFFLFGDLYTDALIAIAMLMLMDTILGVSAAWYEGKIITSRAFGRVVVKGLVYFTAISAGYFADSTIPLNFIQAAMVGFVGVTEFISILENVGRHGYQTPKKLLNDLKAYRDSK